MIWAVAALSVVVLALLADRAQWKARARVLETLAMYGPSMTSLSIYRLLERRVSLGALHVALRDLERAGVILLRLSKDVDGNVRTATIIKPKATPELGGIAATKGQPTN